MILKSNALAPNSEPWALAARHSGNRLWFDHRGIRVRVSIRNPISSSAKTYKGVRNRQFVNLPRERLRFREAELLRVSGFGISGLDLCGPAICAFHCAFPADFHFDFQDLNYCAVALILTGAALTWRLV